MATALRPGRRQEAEAIIEVLVQAFRLREKPEKLTAARRMVETGYAQFLVLEEEGGIAAVARLQWQPLQIGRCTVLKGEVGHVAVRPELQGKGYGTKLMRGVVDHMRGAGCHVSRLGGLMRFYGRFGYEPFLRRYIHIPVAPMDSEMKGRPWSGLRAIPPELKARVRRYDPSRDHAAVHTLLRAYDLGRPGAYPRAEHPGATPSAGPDPEGLEFVYEHDGDVHGYLRGAHGYVHAGDARPSYRVDAYAESGAAPSACEALLKTLIWEAAKTAPTTMSARLPYDERLFASLTRAGIAFNVVEMHPALDGNMMQITNLPGLLEAIAPELSDRLAATGPCPWAGCMEFRLPRDRGRLSLAPGRVRAGAVAGPDIVVETTQATFLKWLFGIAGFAEFADVGRDLTGAQRLALNILFPRLPCASGPWG